MNAAIHPPAWPPGSLNAATDGAQPLCASDDLAEAGRAHVWDVLVYGRPARAFVLRFEGRLCAYLNRCAHVPTEMDWQEGQFLDMDKRHIICSIHGATYEPTSGICVQGPCAGARLMPVRVQEQAGQVHWYPSPDIQPVVFDAPGEPGSS